MLQAIRLQIEKLDVRATFSQGESYQWPKYWYSRSCLPRRLALDKRLSARDWLAWCQYTVTGRDRKFRSTASVSECRRVQLSRHNLPLDELRMLLGRHRTKKQLFRVTFPWAFIETWRVRWGGILALSKLYTRTLTPLRWSVHVTWTP